MKSILLVCIVVCFAAATLTEADQVLELLGDLKANVQREIEALDAAWERHQKNKLGVTDALQFTVYEQQSECKMKDDDVIAKQRDIQITNDFVNWMKKRQSANGQRIITLEANICKLGNSYIHDIKNYKITLALVQFLKQEVDKLSQDNVSLAQRKEFQSMVQKFMKMYHSGKLLTMVETLQSADGSFQLPEMDFEEVDTTEQVLINTRGQKARAVSLISMGQSTKVITSGDDDSNSSADSTVVMIPGCDGGVQTVVVAENDDGSDSNGEGMNIHFSNGGNGGGSRPSSDPNLEDLLKDLLGSSSDSESCDSDSEDSSSGSSSSDSGSGDDSKSGESNDSDSESGESGEESESSGESDNSGESGDEETGESGESGDEDSSGDESSGEDNDSDSGETSGESSGNDSEDNDDSEDGGDDVTHKKIADITNPKDLDSDDTDGEEEDDDFPNTWEGFKKLLDAIEKHTKKAQSRGQDDQVRTAMTYVDFKIQLELENGTFDSHIADELANLIKLKNQLTNRLTVQRQCNARLKQIRIAHQVSLEDLEASKKHYEELRQQKEEDLSVFEDVYRLYENQLA